MKNAIVFRLLTTIAILLFVVIFFSPIWKATLGAPVWPLEKGGVPVNIYVNGGMFNGRPAPDVIDDCDEFLFWVYEMDTLAHYVGMYPMATGAPIVRSLLPFLFAFLIVLLVAFMISGRKFQATALSVGFGIIIVWAYLALFTQGGISWMSPGYQQFVQCHMDMEPDEFQEWSGFEAMQEDYHYALSRWPRMNQDRAKVVETLTTAAYVIMGVLVVIMLIFIVGVIWKNNLFYWLLAIIPMLLPVFFVLIYAGWLYWFGHNLEGGQIVIEPFMPPVLGETKVADFDVTNYPNYGFGLMMLSSVLLLIATSLRLKQFRNSDNS